MDIIVIKDKNDIYKSTYFHVRFGGLKAIKSENREIAIMINNVLTDVTMKMTNNGDGYFTNTEEEESNDNILINIISNDTQNYIKNKNDCNNLKDQNLILNNNKNFNDPINQLKYKKNLNDEELNFLSDKNQNQNFRNQNNLYIKQIDEIENNKIILISNCLNEISNLLNKENTTEDEIENIFLENIIPNQKFEDGDLFEYLKNKNNVIFQDGHLFIINNFNSLPKHLSLNNNSKNNEIPPEYLSPLILLNKTTNKKYEIFTGKNEKNLEKINNIKSKILNKFNNYIKEKYATFYPTSNQLKKFNLKQGENIISFIIRDTLGLSDEQRISSYIYLWDKDDKIIVSDIDGTITKSDLMGYIFPMFGIDWSYKNISNFYTKIFKNGYKFIYLTSRPLSFYQFTGYYLRKSFKGDNRLPKGPILMNPDSVFSSMKREVVAKSAHLLKVAILKEVKDIFPKDASPLYAGIGNRETDAIAYRSVGIDLDKIFFILKGDIYRLGTDFKSNFKNMADNCDEIFPKIK